jgi:hypothetical protein
MEEDFRMDVCDDASIDWKAVGGNFPGAPSGKSCRTVAVAHF